MKKTFESGGAFFALAFAFLVLSLTVENRAVWISLAVVFFVLGMGARRRSLSKKTGESNPR